VGIDRAMSFVENPNNPERVKRQAIQLAIDEATKPKDAKIAELEGRITELENLVYLYKQEKLSDTTRIKALEADIGKRIK